MLTEESAATRSESQLNGTPIQSVDQQVSEDSEPCSSSLPSSSDRSAEGSKSSQDSSSISSSYTLCSLSEVDSEENFGLECLFAPNAESLKTNKVVGDNVNRNVKPNDVRLDSQTQSLNYFQTYAVRDRLDLTDYDDTPRKLDATSIDTTNILPSQLDHDILKSNMAILVARILKQHMKFFESYGSGLERHITHKYYQEMSRKSEVVSVKAM